MYFSLIPKVLCLTTQSALRKSGFSGATILCPHVSTQPIILTGQPNFAYYSSIIPLCFPMPIIPKIMLA